MRLLLLFTLWGLTVNCWSSNLKIDNPILYFDDDGIFAQAWVSWDHAWNNDRNHDAAWIFFKYDNFAGEDLHLNIADSGHDIVDANADYFDLKRSEDGKGIFIQTKNNYRGQADLTIKIRLESAQFDDTRRRRYVLKAYGLEMVYIPAGDFYLGDPSTAAIDHHAVYKVEGDRKGYYHITDERQQITVSSAEGDLYYEEGRGYEGDRSGTIPADYPKGIDAFYVMKYELTQGTYVEFLNTLDSAISHQRSGFLRNERYQWFRGHIYLEDDRFRTEHPGAMANFLTWSDLLAYADWAGLRPMTELEYTKASRGPEKSRYPWGDAPKYQLKRFIDEHGVPQLKAGWSEAQLTHDNQVNFGCSYYWVFELAGGMWERVITIGHEQGRAYQGTHGDGQLSAEGLATNADWPGRTGEGEGFGYRGGGFYWHGRDYHEYNPYSPVGYRPYGGWAGHDASMAYGGRFVRTAK